MYLPAHFNEPDVPTMHALMAQYPLGAWVTLADEALLVNHIPFLLDPSRGKFGTLVGHVARANPVWRSFSPNIPSAVIFEGPQAYITPSWYPGKTEHGKVVPTWNYAVVHAHGLPRVIDDRAALLDIVSRLTDAHEAAREQPWHVSDAPTDFVDGMLSAIVGIELPIAKLVGKWKMSQNRSHAEQLAVATGLDGRGDTTSGAVAEMIRTNADRR